MKIYNPKPLQLVRLTISKQTEETKYLNFIDTTQEECIKRVTSIVDELKLSSFQKGYRTRMDFRTCIGGKNGKCVSVSFRGLKTEELYKLLIDKIEMI